MAPEQYVILARTGNIEYTKQKLRNRVSKDFVVTHLQVVFVEIFNYL